MPNKLIASGRSQQVSDRHPSNRPPVRTYAPGTPASHSPLVHSACRFHTCLIRFALPIAFKRQQSHRTKNERGAGFSAVATDPERQFGGLGQGLEHDAVALGQFGEGFDALRRLGRIQVE